MGKIETIVGLSAIIGIAGFVLQNKDALGDIGSNVKSKFTLPVSSVTDDIPLVEPTETQTITPPVQSESSTPTQLPITTTKRFEDSTKTTFQPAAIPPPPQPNRAIESSSPRGTTKIQGNVRSEIETDQTFQAFSSDSSRPVRGVIRQTKRDPRKLKVDSRKNPLETASQRANRVFTTTGKFADEDRGFGITKAATKTRSFNFGTNTGRGRRIPTTNIGGERKSPTSERSAKLSRTEKLRIEAEKARNIFDARGISNF